MKTSRGTGMILPFLAGVMLLAGCTGPKVISRITSRDDKVKFLYHQKQFLGTNQGLVECSASDDGTLSECGRKPITFAK